MKICHRCRRDENNHDSRCEVAEKIDWVTHNSHNRTLKYVDDMIVQIKSRNVKDNK